MSPDSYYSIPFRAAYLINYPSISSPSRRYKMHRIAVCILLVSAAVFSQTTPPKKHSAAPHRSQHAIAADGLKWGPPPAGAIQGQPPADLPPLRTEIAVLDGDTSK